MAEKAQQFLKKFAKEDNKACTIDFFSNIWEKTGAPEPSHYWI